MAEGSVLSRVRDQYETYPYPNFSWFAGSPLASLSHASYEAGSTIVDRVVHSHAHKKIALLGCGTFEPYAMGKLHRLAHVTAVDLSSNSLKRARWRCKIHWVTNVEFVQSDLITFCDSHRGQFDYIHCYGVIHHLENPQEGFRALARALAPDGFARVMVYSASSRRLLGILHEATMLFGLKSQNAHHVALARKLIGALPWNHPLKLATLINADTTTTNGLVDAILHACEHAFKFDELLGLLTNAGLSIHGWDFSSTLLHFLHDAPGNHVSDKIRWLEAFDQWPAPFTFWISRKPTSASLHADATPETTEPELLKWVRNPAVALSPWRRKLPSTLLRKTIPITPLRRKILDQTAKPIGETELLEKIFGKSADDSNRSEFNRAAAELLNARLILEVER